MLCIRPGWASTPMPTTPGRSTLRSLSVRQQTTTNPERVPWLGVLFYGDGLQLLLPLPSRAMKRGGLRRTLPSCRSFCEDHDYEERDERRRVFPKAWPGIVAYCTGRASG